MGEIKISGDDALIIRKIMYRFSNVFSECFKDVVLRATVWTEPGEANLILIKVMASDIDGRFVRYLGQYKVGDNEFFCDKRMAKAFINSRYRDRAVKSFEDFIVNITKINFPINRLMMDLGVEAYNSARVRVYESKQEKGSIDIHICAYADQVKDDYGFVDAAKIVGTDLATF